MQNSIRIMLALLAFSLSGVAQAQVVLENTIKKVETSVNENGEVQRRMVSAESVVPGDELQYHLRFSNNGTQPVDAGTIVITDAIPTHTTYVQGTAFGAGTAIQFSVDGEQFAQPQDLLLASNETPVVADPKDYEAIRWTFAPALEPGQSGYVSFNVRLK